MPSWKEILEQFAMIMAAPVPFILVADPVAAILITARAPRLLHIGEPELTG
jgi:hypothetical protein